MKNAVLVHGQPSKREYYELDFPSPSNAHWFPWLQQKLLRKDILAQTPEMPRPFSPRYDNWKKQFERFDINANTTLVGHSTGGGFLVRWLSENKDTRVGKVILVAPWLNPLSNLKYDDAGFYDFEIDSDIVRRTGGLIVFSSDNDEEGVQETVRILKEKINNLVVRDFHNYGHFTFASMKTVEFPELLEECFKTNAK